jgi:hypothetical protein
MPRAKNGYAIRCFYSCVTDLPCMDCAQWRPGFYMQRLELLDQKLEIIKYKGRSPCQTNSN